MSEQTERLENTERAVRAQALENAQRMAAIIDVCGDAIISTTPKARSRRGTQRVFADGMAFDYPLTMRHRDGTLTEVRYNASVYRDASGDVLDGHAQNG